MKIDRRNLLFAAAAIRKEGRRLIIEAAAPRSLLAVLATLQTLDENFPSIEDLPAELVDL